MSKIGVLARFFGKSGKFYTSDSIFISSGPMAMIRRAFDNLASEEHFGKLNQHTVGLENVLAAFEVR